MGLLLGGLATVVVHLIALADRWMGPTGTRLLWISDAVELPSALCLLAVVLLVLRYGRERTQALGRVFALGMGLLLLGLTVAGLVGTILLAQPHHSRPAILKALDASSYAVGYLTTLAVAGCFCVLGLARRQESV